MVNNRREFARKEVTSGRMMAVDDCKTRGVGKCRRECLGDESAMDSMGSLMLFCAVAASLALGVLVAYGICQGMFRVFRLHAVAEARSRAGNQGLQMPVRG